MLHLIASVACRRMLAAADQLGKAPPWIEPAGLNWPPSIQTGAYDVAHVYNMR